MPKYRYKGTGVFTFRDKFKGTYHISETNPIIETKGEILEKYPELELFEETRRAKIKTTDKGE